MGDQQLENMFAAASRFAASINYTAPYCLTLSGPSGIGKTMLAKAVWRQFMEQNRFDKIVDPISGRIYGNTGTYCDWRKFCKDLRGGAYEYVDYLCSEWFVVLDDVGSEYDPNGFITSALDRIINSRSGKWTLITLNLALKDIAQKMDIRIADRLLRDGGVVVECKAPSFQTRSKI